MTDTANTPIPLPGPAVHAASITPSNTTVISPPTRFLWVGAVSGVATLSVLMAGDSEPVTFEGVPAGVMLPLSVQQVLVTGTANVSGIVGLS